MIRCMLFLDHGGITPINEWELLGRIDIENNVISSVRTGGKRGNYSVKIYKKQKRLWMKLRLRDFPRQSYHPWEMIRRILNQAAEQNKGRI